MVLLESYTAWQLWIFKDILLGEIVRSSVRPFVVLSIVLILFSTSVSVVFGQNLNTKEVEAASGIASLEEKTSELVIGVGDKDQQASGLSDLISQVGGRIVSRVMVGDQPLAVVADVPSNGVSLLEKKTQEFGYARYFEPNMKFQAQFIPDDPYYANQWALPKIEADWAWNTTVGNKSILVAVIDTGINYDHPDLAGNYNSGGYDWVNNDPDPMDDNGHGTHVAGIVGAVTNNHQGIAGLAQVQIMAEKGLDANGTGTEDDLSNAIIHAVDQGAKILVNSWGGDQDSQLIHQAIRYAYDHGLLIVAAAGNGASSAKMYPAAYKEVIAVTATDRYDAPALFSNYGDWVELAAPGVNILSTYLSGSYVYKSGTSMACPCVAGAGALIWSRFPNVTRDWVRAQLRYTADVLGNPGFDQYYGYGRINARRAVEQIPPLHDVLIFDSEKPENVQPGDTAVFNLTILNFGASDEQQVTAELLVNGNLQNSALIGDLPPGSIWNTELSWNPQTEGTFSITLYVVPVSGETIINNNEVTEAVYVQKRLSVSPSEGPAGTKIVVTGVSFSSLSQVMLTFNDALIGFIMTDALGSFEFTFNVPFSSAGTQSVKASDTAGNTASSPFMVLDETPLTIQVDVGSIYSIQETANFYVQTSFKGHPINATTAEAVVYEPDGTIENLTCQPVSLGLYKIPYTLVKNETGTYALAIQASYISDTIQAKGTCLKSFLVSDTLTLMNQQVVEIKSGIAKVQTDLGLVELNLTAINGQVLNIADNLAIIHTDLGLLEVNLTAMNMTLESIFLYVTAINGNTATIQTTLGTMNSTITSINGDTANILVPGIGQIKTDISGFKQTREAWTVPQYTILSITLIAAIAAILSVIVLLARRQKSGPKMTS